MVLSYRHGFHAGNFADVVKHSTLALLLSHFHRKPSPYYYLDTHAGGPLHSLSDVRAQKTREYLGGIARVWVERKYPNEMEPYLTAVRRLNQLQPSRDSATKRATSSTISYATASVAELAPTKRNDFSWRHLLYHQQVLDTVTPQNLPNFASAYPDEAFDLSTLQTYPGSSLLAAFFQRQSDLRVRGKTELQGIPDRAVLCELHSDEAEILKQYYGVAKDTNSSSPPIGSQSSSSSFSSSSSSSTSHLLSQATRSRFHVMQHSGFHALQSPNSNIFLAPAQGRGLVLVDPPYETADEQNHLLEVLPTAYNRFRNGIYAIWYPLIDYSPGSPKKLDVEYFKSKLQAMGIPKMLCVEFDLKDSISANKTGLSPQAAAQRRHTLPVLDGPSTFAPERQRGLGMTGTGMIIINPTHGFEQQMRNVCEYLADVLPTPAIVDGGATPQTYRARYSIDWLTTEKSGLAKAVAVVPPTLRKGKKAKGSTEPNEVTMDNEAGESYEPSTPTTI